MSYLCLHCNQLLYSRNVMCDFARLQFQVVLSPKIKLHLVILKLHFLKLVFPDRTLAGQWTHSHVKTVPLNPTVYELAMSANLGPKPITRLSIQNSQVLHRL
eukprot:Blabericola_migrator_1__3637@NODE_208_length_11399_cov_361_320155_g179_i0_p7_GENE_NODE_208_length_11399_cov_361_320155_g179_i0NODE_208_length_11399_cov_361_320155_g179_i0_p7_ORF_typecomplete_len102_score19_78zfP11/PF03854_14/0_098_NODE_208_length_11399_cov_361_320155_g179_i0139444